MIMNQYEKGIKENLKILITGGVKRTRKKEIEQYIHGVDDFVKSYDYGHPAPPKRIEIETINKCNGECDFCPANRHNDARPALRMEDDIFKKIIDEIALWNYDGRLGLHSNNEPLLDKKIADKAAYAKNKLSNARIYMYTNGSLLTTEKLDELMQYLSYIIIDNYNDKLELNPSIEKIHQHIKDNPDLNSRVQIHLRKQHEVLSTRGGLSPNNSSREIFTYSCYNPFVQMVFRPDGKVSQCCCDVFGRKTMGDVTQQTVQEIWESGKYKNLRKVIANGRQHIDMCARCDMRMNPY